MEYFEALEESLTVKWKTEPCSHGEACWCRLIVPQKPLEHGVNNEALEIVGTAVIAKDTAEHIVRLHNADLERDNRIIRILNAPNTQLPDIDFLQQTEQATPTLRDTEAIWKKIIRFCSITNEIITAPAYGNNASIKIEYELRSELCIYKGSLLFNYKHWKYSVRPYGCKMNPSTDNIYTLNPDLHHER